MERNELGLIALLGGLALLGLLTQFTDFSLFEDGLFNGVDSEQATTTPAIVPPGDAQRETDEEFERPSIEPPPQQMIIRRFRTVRDLSQREEERAEERNARFRGDEEGEYVLIEASPENQEAVNITGWLLKSAVTGKSASIGLARITTTAGPVRQAIRLNPGDELYVFTGEAPDAWSSFRLNKCSGYLNNRLDPNDFHRPIPNQCPPVPPEELPPSMQKNEICRALFEGSQRACRPPQTLPQYVPDTCKRALRNIFSYNACVRRHAGDDDFQTGQWRFYLDEDDPLWERGQQEIIQLVKPNGVVVDTAGI